MTLDITSLPSLDFLQALSGRLPETTILAVLVLIAYLCGRRTWNRKRAKLDAKHEYEIERTTDIARQLEETANALRHELTVHTNHFGQFKRRLSEAYESGDIESWKAIIENADQILEPTRQFARNLSSAYGSIRQHYFVLESFAQERLDRQPNVDNSQALWESVEELVTSARCKAGGLSIAVVGLDQGLVERASREDLAERPTLLGVARLIESFKFDSYFVVNYGDEDFAIVMPDTRLADACEVGELLRRIVFERFSTTVSCGIAECRVGDNSVSLFMRARSALYGAKACGSNRQFVHTGQTLVERSSGAEAQAIDAPPNDGTTINAESASAAPLATDGIGPAVASTDSSDESSTPDATTDSSVAVVAGEDAIDDRRVGV